MKFIGEQKPCKIKICKAFVFNLSGQYLNIPEQ